MIPGRSPNTLLIQPSGVPAPNAPSGANRTRLARPRTSVLTIRVTKNPAPPASESGMPQARSGAAAAAAARAATMTASAKGDEINNAEQEAATQSEDGEEADHHKNADVDRVHPRRRPHASPIRNNK